MHETAKGWLARHQIGLSLMGLFVWIEETAWRLPGDASYDLLNYHLYGPFALLDGKWNRDLAPAQTQGFLPPTNDLFYDLLARHVGNVHWLNLLLALPSVAAAWLSLLVTLRLIDSDTPVGRVTALVGVVIASTGAATHPVLAMSMSDMIPCSLCLAAILLLLRGAEGFGSAYNALLPGLLAGAALGLKLTVSYVVAACALALLARSDVRAPVRFRAVALFGIGAAVGALALGGWWWFRLWQFSGNPLFPLYNDVFKSPLAWPGDFVDRRFFPRRLAQWLFYPFFWAVDRTPVVTEPDQPMRDARIAIALVAALLMLIANWRGRTRVRALRRFISVFFLVAFALWEWKFSIFRYLSVLEMLSGAVPAALFFQLARSERSRRAVLAGAVVLLALLHITTVTPNWGRQSRPGGPPLPVRVDRLPRDSLVLILDNSPLAYVALFEPDSVRFFGVNNNLTQPAQGGLMQTRIRRAIATQRDDLYGLEKPDFAPGMADQTLRSYGLHREHCTAVSGAIVGTTTRLCRLRP